MPPGFRDGGLRAAIELRRADPEVAVVVLSQYVEPAHAGVPLASGERNGGYLLKDRVAHVRALIASQPSGALASRDEEQRLLSVPALLHRAKGERQLPASHLKTSGGVG